MAGRETFLQRLGIYAEQKRILICLSKRRSIFREELKLPCCLLCMFMLQSCRACDSHLLLLPMHEAEEISLKDNSSFLINNSGDRQKKNNGQVPVGLLCFSLLTSADPQVLCCCQIKGWLYFSQHRSSQIFPASCCSRRLSPTRDAVKPAL